MTALKTLRDDGWKVDEIKFREVMGDTFDEKMSKDELKKVLSNLDIKDYSEAFLSEGISNKSLKGPIIVQLSKWENVSYPKINEHVQNNGVCSLILTDGAKSTKAMTTEPLANISGETPYGTKILLSGDIKLENNILQLNPKNCKFIGGTVEKMVEKWKTERFSSKQDARNTSDAPKWSSISAQGVVAPKKEKDNFKSMAAATESKPSENSEFEAARQQEIANLNALRKNTHIASVKLPENTKKDNIVAEKDNVSKNLQSEGYPKQERYEGKQDKYDSAPKHDKYSNNDNDNGSRRGNNFRKGRSNDNYEDIRTYTSRPSTNATLFDHIRTQMVNPPPETEFKQYDNTEVNSRDNNSQYNNRGGCNNPRQNSSSAAARDGFSQMKISDVPQNPRRGGDNYRNGGTRGRGAGGARGRGRGGKPFYADYGNPYQQPPQFQQQPQFRQQEFPPLFAAPPRPTMFPPPTAGYAPLMSQNIRYPNVPGTETGKQMQPPFTENNVRKTFL
uniref:RecQ mediated genome instability protein 1-like N-terminal helical domain-containing protein n=1 Tax=Panagrolaimus superbus TaxID=310955 RepID=A0A914Y767_9BILA